MAQQGMTWRRSTLGAISALTALFAIAIPQSAQAQARVETLVGTGLAGLADGAAATGQLNRPHGLAIDAQGNVYVSDRGNHAIRVVAASGAVRTLAGGREGNADGTGAAASFRQPIAVAVDRIGNVYVADRDNHTIRIIDPAGRTTIFAGTGTAGFTNGAGASAQFNQPYGVALSPDGRLLYVADYLNHAIRTIDVGSKQVLTLAGNGRAGNANGKGEAAQFNQPYNVKVDASGRLYVPDQLNHAIRRVEPDGTVTTVAGAGQSGFADGAAMQARFNNPTGLAVAADGTLYVADRDNHRIRAITAAGQVSTLAGDGTGEFRDGAAAQARFNRPIDIVLRSDGALIVSEENNHRLRRVLLR